MNRRALVILGIVAVIAAFLGYFLFLNKQEPQGTAGEIQEEVLPTISKEELGLEFELRSDKRAARFTINNVDDIDLVEYQISYTKEINGEEVPEGLIGEVKREPGDKTIESGYREFGTCSSGVCRYDNVTSDIKLFLKITKSDGKQYQAEDTLKL
jgi:hypothetical protein